MTGLDWDISIRKIFWFLLGIVVLLGVLITTVRADSEVTFKDKHLEAAVILLRCALSRHPTPCPTCRWARRYTNGFAARLRQKLANSLL